MSNPKEKKLGSSEKKIRIGFSIMFFVILLVLFSMYLIFGLGFGVENGLVDQIDRNKEEVGLIELPEPETKGEMSAEEAIEERRSIRDFKEREISEEKISQLLWAAQGITDESRGFRTAPSAGATYPLEIYFVDSGGVYNYNPEENNLNLVKIGDTRSNLVSAAMNQHFIGEAPTNIVITAVYERTTSVYGDRGERYVHIEAGHVAQNIHLQAVSLGLGSVPIGAFNDKEVQEVLSIPEEHEPIYIVPVGYPS